MSWTLDALEARRVRYDELIPCRNAFVDTRSPGSDRKENFTIIGPGVAENPHQYVHISEPHGFNVGGARQPGGCLNSQHSHESAEVFIVHSGRWRLIFGPEGQDGDLEVGPGDVASVPIHMFRGFEKIDEGTGFLFVLLGGDDPGRVKWAPSVFDLAKEHGLVLLKGGRLVDVAAGESVPEGAELEAAPDAEELARLITPTPQRLAECVVRRNELRANPQAALAGPGVEECPVIVPQASGDGFSPGPIVGWWPHGFQLRVLRMQKGAATPGYHCHEPEVLFVQRGSVKVKSDQGTIDLGPGDTFTSPQGWTHRLMADQDAEVVVARGTEAPRGPVVAA
ncbi:cupin domain-containing protein [Halomonas sp. DP5N14-9]|uniref:cupin domain-containing protein n=1 Tax=Halomonas sp. DP5N14-9 TaxID=2859075 RepID=UPI001C991903|nr:cupin domain-containing protein [Halomonas sp. DP5N14-9]MBY5942703.1 cupin domain-containing protein [Halomonas sp. DP5N14-9]